MCIAPYISLLTFTYLDNSFNCPLIPSVRRSLPTFSATTTHGKLLLVRTATTLNTLYRPPNFLSILTSCNPLNTNTTTLPPGRNTYQEVRRNTSYICCRSDTPCLCPVRTPQGKLVTTASALSSGTCLRTPRASQQWKEHTFGSYPMVRPFSLAPSAALRLTSMEVHLTVPRNASIAHSAIVPDPQNGSTIASPGPSPANRSIA
mmetsp:Transcript_18941/g.38399  ORF Transcript_18941/g.38399 Transcript_18941/m.38399 type:complete len:204 (+) Transcript_18941:85-696(+)